MRFLVFTLLFLCAGLSKSERALLQFIDSAGNIIETQVVDLQKENFSAGNFHKKKPNPIFFLFKKKQKRNKRITAAILAFPLPFGIVGLHRIYLGTKPYIPVVYVGSLGGGLGVLPFIDFCVLILDKEIDPYLNNGKVFMWVK